MDGSGPPLTFADWQPTLTGHVLEYTDAGPGLPRVRVHTLDEAERLFRSLALTTLRHVMSGSAPDMTTVQAVYELGEATRQTRNYRLQPKRADASPARTASAPVHQETTQ